jgi:hypothetical protein
MQEQHGNRKRGGLVSEEKAPSGGAPVASELVAMHWPEITIDKYEEARRRVNWEADVPDGAIFHVAWMADDGFHVVDVWETAAQFDRFVEDRLMPVIAGEMGETSEPNVSITPAHAVFTP